MNLCCWCRQPVEQPLTVSDVFSFSRLAPPPRCSSCTDQLLAINPEKACAGCSRPQETTERCPDCVKWQKLYPEAAFFHTAFYAYEGLTREWLERYKFKGDYRLASFFRKELQVFKKTAVRNHVVIPIPISSESMEVRGFNQVEGLLEDAGIPYFPALKHLGTGKKQSQKNRLERMTAPQPFRLKEEYREQVQGKRVWLVDDVYTTGRTLIHARIVLEEAGAAAVRTLTIAR